MVRELKKEREMEIGRGCWKGGRTKQKVVSSFHSTFPQIDHADGNEGAPPSHIMPTSSSSSSDHSLRSLGARRKLNLTDIGVGGAVAGSASESVLVGGAVGGASLSRISGSVSSMGGGAVMVGTGTPMKERDHTSSLVGQLHVHVITSLHVI